MCRRKRRRSSSIDPHDEEGFLPPVDPHDEEGFLPPVDPHDEEGFLPPVDPHDEEGFLPPVDPDEWRFTVATKKRRRRGRHRRRGSASSGVLCGDDLGGRPGNVRTSIKKDFSGALVIRLVSQYASAKFDESKTLQDLVENAGLTALGQVFEEYGLPPAPRIIAKRGAQEIYSDEDPDATPKNPQTEEMPVDPAQIRNLERRASERRLSPLHSLLSYWRVDVNSQTRKQVVKLKKRLNKLREVDYAYRELAASDPSDGQDTFEGSQGYLDKAPFGIDARWAAARGGDGSGVKLVDLEQGWIRNHIDFDPSGSDLLHGANRHLADDDYRGDHGTAVLGELGAVKGLGAIGISPPASGTGVAGGARGVARLGLASHYDAKTHSNGHVAEAITAAISEPDPYLQEGDVLLIEVQRSFLPTEVDDADFDAIRLATALGIIVIEAAGNGGRDLDAYQDKRGAHIFNKRGGGFRESGAVLVGAALSNLPHNRKSASNYGTRVDCYAWGNRVVTCGYGDLGGGSGERSYTADFSNTSAAAPIIAGAALILQGMYQRATGGRRLAPGQMRALLANPATGTRQGRGVRGHIGVMPNLRAIVEHSLRIVPDVYMRDSLDDTGGVPATGRVCACPDVLVSRTQRSNPVRVFGQGSGTENDQALAYKAVAGRENFIYVRMKNRGLGDAEKMRATVYWTEAATLSTPDRWHEIGASEPIQVPQGDTLAVAGPISWRSVPKSEIYCLVTLIEDTGEPTRLPPGLLAAEGGRARQKRLGQESEAPRFDWFAFLAFLRNHNHLAIRNFHVIDDIPATGTPKELDFLITGTPVGDRGRFFDLEILQSLPRKAELYFDVPMTLAPAISGSPWRSNISGRFLRFHLPSLPRIPFCRVPLSAGAEHGCRFVVVGADGMASGGHGLAIRQLYRGQEVGRVSWQFHRASGRLRRRLRSRR